MRNKLFTASVDKMLFKQYPLGSNLEKQKVVAKIFNPYGDARWYLLNSDPEDPDYIWAIVTMHGNVEMGSVSRSELLGVRVRPFGLPLERDLYFTPKNAAEVYRGLLDGKFYEDGGEVKEMKQLWFVTDSRGTVKNISTSVSAAEVFLASALKYDGVINYVKVPLKDWESEKVNVGNIRGYASSFWKSYKKGGKIPMIKEADIQVGKVFTLINGEVIKIKRLFAEPRNMDEPWAEYTFRGETSENSVNYLKNFINAWRPMQNGFAKGGEMKNEQEETDFYAITKWHTGEVKLVPITNVSFWQGRQNDHEPTKENLELFFKQIPWDETVCIYDNDTASDGTLHSAHTPLFTAGAKYVHGIVDKKQNPVHFAYKGFFAKGGHMAEGGEIVKERNGKLYREEWARSNRWLEVDSQFKMTKDEHEAKAFQENLNGNYESRDNHKHIAATLSGEPIQLQEHHNRYMAKGGLTNLQGTAPVKKYDFDNPDINVVQ